MVLCLLDPIQLLRPLNHTGKYIPICQINIKYIPTCHWFSCSTCFCMLTYQNLSLQRWRCHWKEYIIYSIIETEQFSFLRLDSSCLCHICVPVHSSRIWDSVWALWSWPLEFIECLHIRHVLCRQCLVKELWFISL